MSRGEFWTFYAIWQPTAILLTWLFYPETHWLFTYAAIFTTYVVTMLPLFAAGARRLQDTGQQGHAIYYPIAPLAIFFFCLFGIPYLVVLGSAETINLTGETSVVGFTAYTVLGLTGFFGLIFYVLFVPLVIIAVVATCLLASNLMGQCLLPSQEGPNEFGPKPDPFFQRLN